MRRYAAAVVVGTLLCVGLLKDAAAQPFPPPPPSPDVPGFELGATLGLWNLTDPDTMVGGRVTRNFTELVAAEIGLDRRRGPPDRAGEGHALLMVDLRFTLRPEDWPAAVFFTAGLASDLGTTDQGSSMFGVGAQSRWAGQFVAVRGEWQYFPKGRRMAYERTRLVLGVSLAIPY